MAYHRQQGVDTSIVRIFNTYGPRMRPNDGRAIPNFIHQALAEKPLTVYGDGSQTRSFCYVDDLIRGLVLLAESGEHLPVNIGNPGEYTILELAEAVLAATGSKSQIVYEALPVDDPQVRQPDITRPGSFSAGSRRSLSTRGCAARWHRSGGHRRVRRLAALAAAALAVPSPRPRADGRGAEMLQVGIFDDGAVLYGEPELVFPQLAKTGTKLAPRQPLVVGPRHPRRDAQAARPGGPERPRLQLGHVRPDGAVRGREQHQRRLLDHRHPAVGERRQGLERRADERLRPPELRGRRAEALQREVRQRRRRDAPDGERSGWRGTSRTTPSS